MTAETVDRELIGQSNRKDRPHITFAPLPPPSFLPKARAVDHEFGFTTLKQDFNQLHTPYDQGNWTFGQICAIILGLILSCFCPSGGSRGSSFSSRSRSRSSDRHEAPSLDNPSSFHVP
jgi:hypothetical protein